MKLNRFVILQLMFVAAAPAVSAEKLTVQLKSLIDGHCVHCHGADTQKAQLRLDTLSDDLSDPAVSRRCSTGRAFAAVVQPGASGVANRFHACRLAVA